MSSCFKCDGELADGNFIECNAYYCTKTFHFDCMGVTSTTKDVVSHNKNIQWFCDLCLEEPLKPIVLGLDVIYNKMMSLESQVQKLQQNLSHFEGQSKVSDGAISNRENVNKNKRQSALFTEINLRSSSVAIDNGAVKSVSGPSKKKKGKKKSSSNINSRENGNGTAAKNVPVRKSIVGSELTTVIKVVKPAESVKYIHVTRVDSSTTDQSLTDYLAAKLGIGAERLKCFRISRRINATLEVVSFKIGVPSDLLDDVFKAEIWPIGVMVREFVNRPRKNLSSKNSHNLPGQSNL